MQKDYLYQTNAIDQEINDTQKIKNIIENKNVFAEKLTLNPSFYLLTSPNAVNSRSTLKPPLFYMNIFRK